MGQGQLLPWTTNRKIYGGVGTVHTVQRCCFTASANDMVTLGASTHCKIR